MIPKLKTYSIRMPEGFDAEIQDLATRLNAAKAGPGGPVRAAGLLRSIITRGCKRYEDKLARLGPQDGQS
jgi:hypothetical protein